MAEFGKLSFSVAFNPTSAFPLDARCYFNSLALAKAAAATAEEVGSTNTVYHYGMKLMVDLLDGSTPKWYTIQADGTLLDDSVSGGTSTVEIDNTLKTNTDGTIGVNVTDKVEASNNLPVSSAAVYAQVGGIETLLQNI